MHELLPIAAFLTSLYSEFVTALAFIKNAAQKLWTAFWDCTDWTVHADRVGAFVLGTLLVISSAY